ncbi:MAG: ribbon-helix-helix protein, CopG family [Candidatus Hodarchaeales archaeon]|jgi:metal-responsive CopG/Arc/MetJ family transcriptional regulator
MSKVVTIRIAENTIKTLDTLVDKKVFRSRNRAIEQFIHEGLEKRQLIRYEEALKNEQD